MAAIGELLDPTYGRPDASKVIILATDGSPTGSQQLPVEVSSWCQTQGLQLYSREDTVVCISRYAQSTTAPDTPAEAIGMCPYGFCHKELKAMGATVVTITGTLGGSLNGTPSLVTKTIGKLSQKATLP